MYKTLIHVATEIIQMTRATTHTHSGQCKRTGVVGTCQGFLL
uniref:Uncharacterized protein n=1 Tax=Anguilla anguilla TaxID=7936 RepID=A0A0E9PEK3_ANGAN